MAKARSSGWALWKGQTLARAGKTGESLVAFNAAGASDDPRLLVQHALALARAGQSNAALEKSARAVAQAPDDAVPAVFNAYLLLRSGRTEPAVEELRRAAILSPKNPMVPSLSAAVDILAGRLADGCERLLGGPRTDNLEVLGWILAAVERQIFERVGTDSGAIPPDSERSEGHDKPPETIPNLSARACAKRGQRHLEAGRPRTAAVYLARAVEGKPDDAADQRAMYGAALFESGQFEPAEAELAQAPEDGPLADVARFYRAANAYRLGDSERAIELLDAVGMAGDMFLYQEWADYIRGMALVALGRTDRAAAPLAAFIDAEPTLIEQRLKKAIEIGRKDEPCSTQS